MWVLVRIGFALVVFLTRALWRRRGIERASVYADTRQVLSTDRRTVGPRGDRVEIIARLFWGLEVRTPLVFSLHRESRWDRAVKWLGLVRELQTGDEAFDRDVYVAGDHPALHRLLAENARLRAAIRGLLAKSAARIFCDGRILWVESADLAHASSEDLRTLHGIAGILQRNGPPRGRWFLDRFLWTAVLVEALAWSAALYGTPGAIELLYRTEVLGEGRAFFDYWAVARPGLVAAGGAWAVLLGLAVLLLRGSSRGRRVLAECVVVLSLGLPLSGVQAVVDFNASRDTAPPRVHEYRVAAKLERAKGDSRPGWWTGRRLVLEPVTAGAPRFAGAYPVSREVFAGTPVGGRVRFTVRTGRLGIPWISSRERP